MNHRIFWLSMLCFSATLRLSGQAFPTDFQRVDSLAQTFGKAKFRSPDELAIALTKPLASEAEKARAIFVWLATNIRYDMGGADREAVEGYSQQEVEKKKNDAAVRAFSRKKGICEDYSRLFKMMAAASGLEAQFIGGFSKGSIQGGWETHAWNAVKIGGKWQLLDATWGAGYVDAEGKFRARLQAGYFCPDPRLFALNHFPDDPKWQLLDAPLDKKTFRKLPVSLDYGSGDWPISDASPLFEPAARDADGNVEIRLRMAKPPAVVNVKAAGRIVQAEREEQGGWLVLRFPMRHKGEVRLLGTDDPASSTRTVFAVFDVE